MMHSKLLTGLLLLSLPALSLAQIKGKIIDEKSKQPVAFANVSVLDTKIGTTTNEDGTFAIPEFLKNQTLVVNAMGYKVKSTTYSSEEVTVLLQRQIYQFPDVIIPGTGKPETIIINKVPKKSNTFFSCYNNPWMLGRYFENSVEYKNAPFIKKVTILANTKVRSAKFNFRLLSVSSDGKPETDILNKNMIVTTERGQDTVVIDLSEYNIRLPKNGVFVVMEWLITEENRWTSNSTEKIKKEKDRKITRINYDPQFSSINRKEGPINTWLYSGGEWKKQVPELYPAKTNHMDPAVELTLGS